MKYIWIFILAFCYLLGPYPKGTSAKSLDIFNSVEPFTMDYLPKNLRGINLEKLDPLEIPAILQQYLTIHRKQHSIDVNNLLTLSIAYLYLRMEEYEKVSTYFNDNILGNFILEDYRLYFQSRAHIEMAAGLIDGKKYTSAIKFIDKAIKVYMLLYKSYPDSPFQSQLPKQLAHAERLLGDVQFKMKNFKHAWQAYRRSLMRNFPGNKVHRAQVMLALAKTYEAAGDIENAADQFAYLMKNQPTEEAVKEAKRFVNINKKQLRKKDVSLKELLPPKLVAKKSSKLFVEAYKEDELPSSLYQNKLVQQFYDSLSQENKIKSLELAHQVLIHVPGIIESLGIIPKVSHLIRQYVYKNEVVSIIDQITDLYTAKALSQLGFGLWRDNRPRQAVFFYEKILRRFPLDIVACHKATFFLGRLWEDQAELDLALKMYQQVIDKYNYGLYTVNAKFKIPWIKYLQKKNSQAKSDFEALLKFYTSSDYDLLAKDFSNTVFFQPATYYWLAQVEFELGQLENKKKLLKQLIHKYPLDFYSIMSYSELGIDLKQFLTTESGHAIAARNIGLGESDRKRLRRAEKLIAFGLLDSGARELASISKGYDNPEFIFYLSRLFEKSGGFQKSIQLVWSITRRDNHHALSQNLTESLFPKAFWEDAKKAGEKNNLDPWLVLSLMRQESAFNPGIISSADAVGLMQLLPSTAADVARSMNLPAPVLDELKTPETNTLLGTKYLSHLLEQFDQNIIFALAAYNAGPHRVKSWIEIRKDLKPLEFMESIPYFETRAYVKKVLRNYAIYLALYQGKAPSFLKDILTMQSH